MTIAGKEKKQRTSKLAEALARPFLQNEAQEKRFHKVSALAEVFSERAAEIDETASFPFENINELKQAGYTGFTVPAEYGGEEISLYEFLLLQERIAQGDSSTALSIGWHLGVIYDLRERRIWEESQFEWLCRQVVTKKTLINRAASEVATGSPTRGGLPETNARLADGGWIINGRKSFTSVAPALSYSLVTATIEDTGEIGVFLVDHELEGISIEENWDMLGMRGTRSDDLVLKDVKLPADALVERETGALNDLPRAWLLHIPACYLGIAAAARNYAVEFASTYQPNSLPAPIKTVPEVQRKVGEMDLELLKARQVLYATALRWDTLKDYRDEMGPELLAAKHIAVNSANQVVDWAMRITGVKSLQKSNPLQRYYRDVRTGLHTPPMDDAVIANLAKKAFQTAK